MMNITRAPINIHEWLWWMQLHVRSTACAPLRALRCVRSAACAPLPDQSAVNWLAQRCDSQWQQAGARGALLWADHINYVK